jgi:hypothetical protein
LPALGGRGQVEIAIYPDSVKLGIVTPHPEPMRAIFKRPPGEMSLASYFEREKEDETGSR